MPPRPLQRPAAAGALALLGAAALALACASGRRARFEEVEPAEVLIEVLPRNAEVELDGRALGPGSRTAPAPTGADEHVLRVRADGYSPVERVLPPGSLAGVRLAEALRPEGFGGARALEYDDAPGLAAAGAALARSGRAEDAIDYASRAAALDPRLPLAQRALGDAFAERGDAAHAAAAWGRYLQLAPGAPDAAAIADRLSRLRGDVALPVER